MENKCYSISYAQGTYTGKDGIPHTYDPDGDFIYASSDEEAILPSFNNII